MVDLSEMFPQNIPSSGKSSLWFLHNCLDTKIIRKKDTHFSFKTQAAELVYLPCMYFIFTGVNVT